MRKYVKTKNGRTFYIHDTPGDAGTIIATHGLTGNHKQFQHYQAALSGNYRFISYDVLGRGNSDSASDDTSIDTHAHDLLNLIDTLEIKDPILMGYSMGAYICAIAASKLSTVKALILLDGAGDADDTSRQLVLPSLTRLENEYRTVDAYVSKVEKLYTNLKVNWTDTIVETVKYDLKEVSNGWTHKSDYTLTKQDFESFYTFKPEEIFKDINVKTLLFIATGTIGNKAALFQESGYERIQHIIPTIKTHVTTVNHYELVFNEQPKINEQIMSFLKEVN